MERAETIRVKRAGPRGWHSIPAASFDPAVHERWGEAPKTSDSFGLQGDTGKRAGGSPAAPATESTTSKRSSGQ